MNIEEETNDISEEEEEIVLCMGKDGVLHLKEKRPTISLAFKKEEDMVLFMSKLSVLCLKSTIEIPESTLWGISDVLDQDTFLENVNLKIDELKGE